jgi:hypothetical protein
MALVDLKSKLNEFGENNPDNPYKKGEKKTDLQSKVDVDNEKYLESGEKPESQLTKLDSRYDRENTPKSNIKRESSFGRSIKSFVEDFGRSSYDVPTSGNYEDGIKIESSDALGEVVRGVKSIENTIKAAKDIFKGNVSKGIRTALEGTQDNKLSEYNATAYGKIKLMGEPGRKVVNIDRRIADIYKGPIKGGLDSKNVNRANIQPKETTSGDKEPKDKDLIPFRFTEINKTGDSEHITFSAILSGITDTITPEYSSERYIGRPQSVYTYQGVERALSFTFDIFPATRQEMRPLWEKIEYLVGLCYPTWVDSPYPQAKKTYTQKTMVSPIVELTIGDMYRRTPGFLSSVTMTVQDGTTWEFEEKMKLPHYVQIACEFTYIGKPEAFTNGYLFDLGWPRKGKLSGNNPEFDKTWKMRTKEEREANRKSRLKGKSTSKWKTDKGKARALGRYNKAYGNE